MDTDQLEHDMNDLCHEWMHGRAPADRVRTWMVPIAGYKSKRGRCVLRCHEQNLARAVPTS